LLAQEVHLSRFQLVRAFDATAGVSPMACLRQMRAQQMAWVLCCTDPSIAAVARSVG
jgi:AraC-like DNA-binding protein